MVLSFDDKDVIIGEYSSDAIDRSAFYRSYDGDKCVVGLNGKASDEMVKNVKGVHDYYEDRVRRGVVEEEYEDLYDLLDEDEDGYIDEPMESY